MTKVINFTQGQIKRAVRGVEATGLRVTGITIRPDGSITIESDQKKTVTVDKKEIVL